MGNAAESGMAFQHVESRRTHLHSAVPRKLEAVGGTADPLPRERLEYLLQEAQDLYWNELSWEEITEEEAISGGRLTEMVFPGFLAFVDGLLLDRLPARVPGTARPHPEVVEEVLLFLGERYTELSGDLAEGADSQRLVWSRAMTAHLIDLVLFRLYRLSPEEREALEPAE